METTTKPRRGIDLVRKLVAVKEAEQKAFQEAYRSDPSIRVIFDELKRKNAQRQPTE